MKKIVSIALTSAMSFQMITPIYAQEEYSNEDYWYDVCSKPQDNEESVNACLGFQDYQKEQMETLRKEIEKYKDDLDSLEANSSKIEEMSKKQNELANALEAQIQNKEDAIATIAKEIESLKEEIQKTQEEIEDWKAQIASRMQTEQVNTGTNILVDLVMGAKDLNDVFRRFTGIERITASDQDQVDQLKVMEEELNVKKSEQERLSQETEEKKAQLEEQKQFVKELQEDADKLAEEYHKQEAETQEAMQKAFNDVSSVSGNMISSGYSGTLPSVSGFSSPINGASISAGTWAYPGGGLHLGMDWAAPIGTPLLAPASGVIIYAANPVASNSGYLGNWSGYPFGGGNTIEMLCSVNGTLYAVSFAHLAQEGFAVSAGQSVSAGQVMALTGNSGNSSGPHTHIEVYNLGNMSLEDAIAQFSANADFAWGTGWATTATSCEATGTTPCRERPERFFQ